MHINNQLGISDSLIFYCDTVSFLAFTKTLSHDASIYYGSFITDSIQIAKSPSLKTNESCKGRIGSELVNLVKMQRNELELDTSVNLKMYHFHNIKNENINLTIENNKRYTILLIYFYSFGRYYDDLYKEIITAYKRNPKAYDLKIITLDNQVAYLK